MKQHHVDLPYVVVRQDGYTTYHATLDDAEFKAKQYLRAFPYGDAKVFHAKLVLAMKNNIEPYVQEVAID